MNSVEEHQLREIIEGQETDRAMDLIKEYIERAYDQGLEDGENIAESNSDD